MESPQQNISYTAQEFYDKMVQMQKKIHGEISLASGLEEFMNKNNSKDNVRYFFCLSEKMKHHYISVFFITQALQQVDKKTIIIPSIDSFSQNIRSKERLPMPASFSEDYLSDFLDNINIKNQNKNIDQIIDLLTYSTIPSLFQFFLDESQFNLFIKNVINPISDQKKKFLFSRSLFVSPLFLKFISIVFKPIFAPFCNLSKEIIIFNTEKIKQEIIDSFEDNMASFPLFIQIFLESVENPNDYIKFCFFDQMTKCPELFSVFDPWQTDNDPQIAEKLKMKMKIIFDDSDFIAYVTDVILSASSTCNSFIKMGASVKNFHKASYYRILDNFDFEAYRALTDNQSMNLSVAVERGYNVFKSYFENDTMQSSVMYLEQTNYNLRSGSAKIFRKILKEAPPLPENQLIENNCKFFKDILKFVIKPFLVDVGNPFISARLVTNYRVFEELTRVNDYPFNLNNYFESMKVSHHEEQVDMGRSAALKNELTRLELLSKFAICQTRRLLHLILMRNIEEPMVPKYIHKISNDPRAFNGKFDVYYQQFSKATAKYVGTRNMNSLIYIKFCKNLRFLDYVAQRPELQEVDNILSKFFVEKYLSILNYILSSTHDMIRNTFANVIKHIYFFDNAALQLKNAYIDNIDPLTKCKKIANAFKNATQILNSNFGISEEDYLVPFRILMLAYTNPPYFMSNFVYILEYLVDDKCIFMNKPYMRSVRCVLIALTLVFNTREKLIWSTTDNKDGFFRDFHLFSYSRNHNFKKCVQICGDNHNLKEGMLQKLSSVLETNKNLNETKMSKLKVSYYRGKHISRFVDLTLYNTDEKPPTTVDALFYAYLDEKPSLSLMLSFIKNLNPKETAVWIVLPDNTKTPALLKELETTCRKKYSGKIFVIHLSSFANEFDYKFLLL